MNEICSLIDCEVVSKYHPEGSGAEVVVTLGDKGSQSIRRLKIYQEGKFEQEREELESRLSVIRDKVLQIHKDKGYKLKQYLNSVGICDAQNANLYGLLFLIETHDKRSYEREIEQRKRNDVLQQALPELYPQILEYAKKKGLRVDQCFNIEFKFDSPRTQQFTLPARYNMPLLRQLESEFDKYKRVTEAVPPGCGDQTYDYKQNDNPTKIVEQFVHWQLASFLYQELQVTHKEYCLELTAAYCKAIGFSSSSGDAIRKSLGKNLEFIS